MSATVIWFRDLDKWSSPKKLRLTSSLPDGWTFASIDNVAKQISERVKVEKDGEYKLIGVRWYGEGTFHRETVKGSEISASYLTPVIPSAFIYNRLFAWKQSFAIVPAEHSGFYVSSEFPQFIADTSKIIPEYLYLIFRLEKTIKSVLAASVGSAAISRNRFKEDEFLKFEIPLPPLDVQRAIVARWQAAQESAREADERANKLETDVPRLVLETLGIPFYENKMLPKVFACQWSSLENWGVGYTARAFSSSKDLHESKFPLKQLGRISQVSYGIQKSPANRPGKNARPYLRVANVQKGQLNLSEIKYINVTDTEMETLRLQKGDLLVCEGNSADLVGRPAIWNNEVPDCVHQNHILKARVNPNVANSEFILEYMQTLPARTYFRGRAKFTTNLASINSNDLRELPVPLPPLDVQQSIVEKTQASRAEIARQRERAAQIRREAEAEVEALILGTKKIV